VSNATLSPTTLFGRRCTVQVGSLLIQAGTGTGLDLSFTVKRGVKVTAGQTKPQPNTCELTLVNLSPTHRKQLETSTTTSGSKTVVPVVISAGYQGRQTQIFSGELRAATTQTDGPKVTTTLTTGDGDQALAQKRLTIHLGPGANAKQGIQTILTGLGIGQGNLNQAIDLLQSQPLAAQLFSLGVTLKGQAAELMTDFCRSSGLDWSIQNGALQLTQLGQPVAGQAILIDSDHGLIGSPSVDTTGLLSLKTEMIPNMFPGTKLSMNALQVTGGFRVLNVETKGDTFGNDWGHAIEAQRY
jgi:hypothetical protein